MTARSMRRAQERRAKKLARKDALRADKLDQPIDCEPTADLVAVETAAAAEPASVPVLSGARLAANRANAQLSTGPRTAEGKSRSSINAVKTALTGRTVLLPSDDAALYQEHLARYAEELQPITARESVLVQSIADTDWRLARIPVLEAALFALGREEQASAEPSSSSTSQSGFADLHTFLKYEKQLRNLQLQEARLRRHREKDLAELRSLQQTRIAEERQQLEEAAMLYTAAQHDGRSWNPADHGFEFSLSDIISFIEGARAAKLYRDSMKQAKAAA